MYSPINFKSLLCFLRECFFLKALPVSGSLPDGVPDRATMPNSFYVGPQLMSLLPVGVSAGDFQAFWVSAEE